MGTFDDLGVPGRFRNFGERYTLLTSLLQRSAIFGDLLLLGAANFGGRPFCFGDPANFGCLLNFGGCWCVLAVVRSLQSGVRRSVHSAAAVFWFISGSAAQFRCVGFFSSDPLLCGSTSAIWQFRQVLLLISGD